MRYRLLLALPALLASVGAPPAHASYYGAGVTCGMHSAGGTTQVGVMFSGPWTMPDAFSDTVTSITVTCRLQINDPSYDGTGQSVETTFHGDTGGLGERDVTYDLAPGELPYVCTTVSWTGSDGTTYTANVDFGAVPGEQCARGIFDSTTKLAGSYLVPAQPLTFTD